MSASVRNRDATRDDEMEPSSKRIRMDIDAEPATPDAVTAHEVVVYDEPEQEAPDNLEEQSSKRMFPVENLLPPSRSLLGASLPDNTAESLSHRTVEFDVGISEYVSRDLPPIHGIIKQRFTDFLVYEVNLDNEVVHIKTLAMSLSEARKPQAVSGDKDTDSSEPQGAPLVAEAPDVPNVQESNVTIEDTNMSLADEEVHEEDAVDQPKITAIEDANPWPEHYDATLKPFLSDEAIVRLKQMFLEGPEPPLVSDSGWAGRQPKAAEVGEPSVEKEELDTAKESKAKAKRGKRGRGRGGRDGGDRRGPKAGKPEDHRKVFSDPISSKTLRTELHKTVRDLFGGKLDSETDTTAPAGDEGSKIVIKWAKRGQGRDGGRGGRDRAARDKAPRGTYPPYIHFTLQKTNRDTQDALSHLSRMLRVNIKDLSVAGTKDKRGVTTQRVSLKRNGKTVEDVWKLANGQIGRKSLEEALTQRGDRGVRVADLNYRKSSLELGMLKGNAFVITLRNVQVASMEILNQAMNSIKSKGFINYYGMQRFGTASIPTHAIGLALLQSDWNRAVSLILRHRPGEHPDIVAARDAWLEEGDYEKALDLMPRRVVAERCILESYKKQNGETRNAMGALSTIPRNLRLMYVHAYQSYVWNAIVSERIKLHGADKPVAGDLVFDEGKTEMKPSSPQGDGDQAMESITDGAADDKLIEGDAGFFAIECEAEPSGPTSKRSRKPWEQPKVKTLIEEDLDKYTIFDVIMPLPGKDVAYPGDSLGERYREFLRLDGLDPDNFVRKQKDYNLSGSYRKIIHLPNELSWSILRYTDPDVSLAQADEDKLLGFDPPVVDEDGKFVALQIQITLGTAAYATMALREVTKTETSSHFQMSLTQASADQEFKGTVTANNASEILKSGMEE